MYPGAKCAISTLQTLRVDGHAEGLVRQHAVQDVAVSPCRRWLDNVNRTSVHKGECREHVKLPSQPACALSGAEPLKVKEVLMPRAGGQVQDCPFLRVLILGLEPAA